MVERRLTWLAGIVFLWGAAILAKLFFIEVIHHNRYLILARARQELVIPIPAPRGAIFDRNGQPLALSVPTESVYINPLKVPDLEVAAELLALVLHMDRVELYGRMKLAYDNRRGYLVVKRKITFDEGQSLRNLALDWIDIERSSQRHYPNGTLAAHVLGGVDFEEKGNAGIEKALNDELQGQPGQERLLTDVKRRGIDSQKELEARAGTPVTLTLDERLQFVAEREIAAAVNSHHAQSGSVVVMNPYNGQILAMASYPTYDPNKPPGPGDLASARFNHAVSVPFEPGSVFKVITLTAALETTSLKPESPINCNGGKLTLFGRTIHDSHMGYGVMPMAMVLAKSSNVGAVQVGMRVGQESMYEYVRRFGFGQKTGIPLPGESRGRLRPISRWTTASLPSMSIGQEISVTTIQLAQAASAVANGGLRVKPVLVLKKGGQPAPVEPPVRIMRPETAITMRQMMEGVVMPGGTGYPKARLEGYSVGGKTGSAQIFEVATHRYSHNTYNGSFIGMAPLTNPQVVVAVTLNGTHGTAGFGGAAAAPVFHAVTTEALRMLEVPRDLPDDTPSGTLVTDASDADDSVVGTLAADEPNILEDGEDDDAAAPPDYKGPKAPNFRGMTMRAVLAEAAAKGLTILPTGSGVARVQDPPPGAPLRQGERIRVTFAR
ncbi:MAG TPA: penicillin-binding protein [Bryobacteraceae bacterium]